MDEKMSVDKNDDHRDQREGTEDSMDSNTPDAEAGATGHDQDGQPPAKRKGGRKPIYATSEERKQRNRQAQAAFRERRTEYIKQLEDAIRVHETNLHNLNTAHRAAADECLMLRYKNSLLERILLEKGIDVQAELRLKTGSPSLGPTHMAPALVQPPTVQRAIMNRHHQARRSNSNIAPKVEPGPSGIAQSVHGNPSPQSRPTPSSHHSSPTSNSPGYPTQGVMTPPGSEAQMQQQRMGHPIKPQIPHGLANVPGGIQQQQIAAAMKGAGNSGVGSMGGPASATAFYPPPFRSHIEQLEQEYDAENDIVDHETNEIAGPGPYPNQQMHGQQYGGPVQQQIQHQQPSQQGTSYGSINNMMYPFDSNTIDADPFGLSASMSFPTSFSFDTSSMR